jgi:ABC-type lipoprotein export system ATPase subunit
MSAVLRLVGVSRGFARGKDRVVVLRDVSLSVDAERLVAVLGGRLAGKSTLIRVASGTLPAEDGDVFVDGQPMVGISDTELSEVLALKVGLAGRAGPDAKLDVGSYVEMRLTATRAYSRRRRREEVKRTLAEFDLAGTEKLMWSELSDWQRVAVELAQAVIVRPRLLLVDDILDGLARSAKNAALEMLEGFARELGCGVLMAVSDHTTASRGAQVYQLTAGKLRLMHNDPDIINLQDHRPVRAAAK